MFSNYRNIAIIIVSIVVYLNGICLYWIEDDDDRRNPCGPDEMYVPDNAMAIYL